MGESISQDLCNRERFCLVSLGQIWADFVPAKLKN